MYSDKIGMWQFVFASAKQARLVRSKLKRRGIEASTMGRCLYTIEKPRWSTLGVAPYESYPPIN
jgi:hypothetical protein